MSLPSEQSTLPTILLLSLDKQPFWDEQYSGLVDAIAAKVNIKRAVKPEPAMNYLTNNNPPKAIVVTDGALAELKTRSLDPIREQLVKYVREDGGTVVLATHFSSFVLPVSMGRWFATSWELPWKSGDYHRTTFQLNQESDMAGMNQNNERFGSLASSYSQKALHLKNVSKKAAVYLPTAESRTQSMVFPASTVDTSQSPIAFTQLGEGWLGYIGDVNNEDESQAVLLAMLKL